MGPRGPSQKFLATRRPSRDVHNHVVRYKRFNEHAHTRLFIYITLKLFKVV